ATLNVSDKRATLAGMLTSYSPDELSRIAPDVLGDALERGEIVHFPRCPIELPDDAELKLLREELPGRLRNKNISYHPETDSVAGLKAEPGVAARVEGILKQHAGRVESFLQRTMPTITRDWTIGTSSFRPIQEKGRDLSPHASNELVHIDAGAYGRTNGDRILRFFVNVNPVEDLSGQPAARFRNATRASGKRRTSRRIRAGTRRSSRARWTSCARESCAPSRQPACRRR
ncbi:MAG: Kdo hydroxylase family protein, partial [Burkholderiales bacterium]